MPSRRRILQQVSTQSLTEYVKELPRRPGAPAGTLLIFDQFEEILTADPLDISGKRDFFNQLGDLLQDSHIRALFAMREDYLAPLDPYAQQVPTHLQNRFRINRLQIEQAEEAAGPAATGRPSESIATTNGTICVRGER